MVPLIIFVLAHLSGTQPALAGRVKAAAMQLLPPLLDGLHARRLAGQPDSGWSEERLQDWTSANAWVSVSICLSFSDASLQIQCQCGRQRISILCALTAQSNTKTCLHVLHYSWWAT